MQKYFQNTQHQAHNASTNRYPSFTDNGGDVVYILPFFAHSIPELVRIKDDDLQEFLYSELVGMDGVMTLSGDIMCGADIQDHLPSGYLFKY